MGTCRHAKAVGFEDLGFGVQGVEFQSQYLELRAESCGLRVKDPFIILFTQSLQEFLVFQFGFRAFHLLLATLL